jgi:hypothetical protein
VWKLMSDSDSELERIVIYPHELHNINGDLEVDSSQRRELGSS